MDIPPGHDPVLDAKRGLSELAVSSSFAPFSFSSFSRIAAFCSAGFRCARIRTAIPRFTFAMRKVAFVGLPLFALCLTFGAFDWLMGLN